MAIPLQLQVPDRPQTGIQYCQSTTKRVLDIIGALIGIIFYTPALLLSLAAIKLIHNGQLFYQQERFGFGGKAFTIIKVCSLQLAEKPAEVNGERIQHKPEYVTTPTGKFLRRHSLDEIPQLWLVLKGDMSLVGHRAFPMYYVPHLAEMPGMDEQSTADYLDTISQYKPGMTALSAINGRANLSMQEKIAFDLHYAREASLWRDLQILIRTQWVVFTCEGAR